MSAQFICQVLVVLLALLGFFKCLSTDFDGQTAKPPGGFRGAIITIIVTTLMVLVYWKAGALSLLLP